MKWIKASERLPENRRANYIFRQAGNIRSATSEYLAHAGNNIEGYFKLPLTDLEWLDESAQLSPGYSKEQMGEAYRSGFIDAMNHEYDLGYGKQLYLDSLPPTKDAGILVEAIENLITELDDGNRVKDKMETALDRYNNPT
jgi:hypothetical protein